MKYCTVLVILILLSGSASPQYALRRAFPNVPFLYSPVEMQTPADETNRIFIIELKGRIIVFQNDPNVSSSKVFLDITDKVPQGPNEMGVLGLAFHPDFQHNGFFYVNYLSYVDTQLTSFISRFQASPTNPDSALRSSEQILLTVPQPFTDHNGGHLAFGNDGYLYASFGDGGGWADPYNNGQSLTTYLGKILRINVDQELEGNHYSIPSDNPFISAPDSIKREIYAYGLRNPWKFSIDRSTGTLWTGDVGFNNYEEVDTIKSGGNYGWRIMEGFHRSVDFGADTTTLVLPLYEYPHSLGAAVIGGYVYRGNLIPSLEGKYIYADYASSRIWALTYGGTTVSNRLLVDHDSTGLALSSFGEDQEENLYVLGISDGNIYQLISTLGVEDQSVHNEYSLRIDQNIIDSFKNDITCYFNLPFDENISVAIVDVTGHIVRQELNGKYERGKHSFNIDCRGLRNGMYFLQLHSSLGTLGQKMIFMR